MQSPGIDGGFVVCLITVLLVEPEAGENGPVKPAAVHFARAALTVNPSSVGTRRHDGDGDGVGAGVAVGVGVGRGSVQALVSATASGTVSATGVGAGLGVIAPELIVIPEVHGHHVPDWRLCPTTVKLPDPTSVIEPRNPRSDPRIVDLVRLQPDEVRDKALARRIGVGPERSIGSGNGAPKRAASEKTTADRPRSRSMPVPKRPQRSGVTRLKV